MRAPDIRPFLEEDVESGDITSEIFLPDRDGEAVITVEQDAVVAGLDEAITVFSILGAKAEQLVKDGDSVSAGTVVLKIKGSLKALTTCERTALNFLMRMSGIATLTHSVCMKVRRSDPSLRIAATRKTTPGFRYFEKKAVSIGGGWPHRFGLFDMVMVKDNHIAAVGGLDEIVKRMKDVPDGVRIEIEVLNQEEGILAAKAGADIIMADHFKPADAKRLRDIVKSINPNVLLEVSGNITSENVTEYAGCADIVSLGELTHSPKAIHFSMDID